LESQGEILKNTIKSKGYRVEDAAIKMGVSRQTLQAYFKAAKLSAHVINSVKTNLDIDLHEYYKPPEGDCRELEIKLEAAHKEIELLREMVGILKGQHQNIRKGEGLSELNRKQPSPRK